MMVFWAYGPVNAQIVEETGIKCFGDSTGQIGIYPDFGISPYTYVWNNGQTSQIISGLKSGYYSVTVTDSLGADKIFLYHLIDPAKITTAFTLAGNNFWPLNTGSITINASGGTGWYKYSIKDSVTRIIKDRSIPVFDSLASGAYYGVTSDLNNCLHFDTVHIIENAGLQVYMDIDTTACYRSTAPTGVAPSLNGAYPVAVTFDNSYSILVIDTVPGLKPYVLSDLIDTVKEVSGDFTPGFHIVTVSANDGKGFRYSWTVDSVVAPISITWTQNNVLCFGKNTGSISSLAQGSYNRFTYKITGPSYSGASRSASGLYAGTYKIVATDFTGCTSTQSVIISQPDEPLHIEFDDQGEATCQNAKNGNVNIHRVDGSVMPVSYLWSNGATTTGMDSLFTGTYHVSVTDGHGCTAFDSISVNISNEPFHIFFDIPRNADCNKSSDGEINIHSVEGVTGPLSYLWSNGGTTGEISSLPPRKLQRYGH